MFNRFLKLRTAASAGLRPPLAAPPRCMRAAAVPYSPSQPLFRFFSATAGEPLLISPKCKAVSTTEIILTPTATVLTLLLHQRLLELKEKAPEEKKEKLKLRVGIDSGGCGGYQYTFNIDYEEPTESDL